MRSASIAVRCGLGLAVLATSVTACTSSGGGHSASSSSAVGSTGAVSGGPSASGSAAHSSSGSSRPRPTATFSTIPSVAVTTRPAVPVTATASFGGGFTANLVSYRSVKVKDQGPGALTGRAATAFTIRFHNGTQHRIALNTVQVNVTYGKNLAASPVNQNSGNAHGTLSAGGSGEGTYSFAIPTNQLGHVRVAVSADPKHPTVVFAGSVRH